MPKAKTQIDSMLDSLKKNLKSEGKTANSVSFETMSFKEYLEVVRNQPWVTRNTQQLIHDMMVTSGVVYDVIPGGGLKQKWNFFTDKAKVGKYTVFGQSKAKNNLIEKFSNSAKGLESSKRLWILLGPPGSAKSRSMEGIKTALNLYSKSEAGKSYMLLLPTVDERLKDNAEFTENGIHYIPSPTFEPPLQVLNTDNILEDTDVRDEILSQLNESLNTESVAEFCEKHEHYDGEFKVELSGRLTPYSVRVLEDFMKAKGLDFFDLLDYIKVKRLVFDAKSKTGIGSYTPRDEKSQEAGSLVGNLDYSALPKFGNESHPLVHDYKGELCAGSNGFVEIHEILKLSDKFLYELLFATQDRFFKPEGQPPIPFNGVIIGHTNFHEYNAFLANPAFEALRSRTTFIEMPLSTNFIEEEKIYDLTYSNYVRNWNNNKKNIAHAAPYSSSLLSLAAAMSRIHESKKASNISLLQKALIYAGRADSGLDSNTAKTIIDEYEYYHPSEGTFGLDPRFMQNVFEKTEHMKIMEHNANLRKLNESDDPEAFIASISLKNPCVTPLDLHKVLEHYIKENFSGAQRTKFETKVLPSVRDWILSAITSDVYSAILKDDTIIETTWKKYTDHVKAYAHNSKVKHEVTQAEVNPDEKFMRVIESYMGIPDRDTFRKELSDAIASLGIKHLLEKEPTYQDAIKKFIFENEFRSGENMKLLGWIKSGQSAAESNNQEQEKLNDAIEYLIKEKGYCGHCALQALIISANSNSIV